MFHRLAALGALAFVLCAAAPAAKACDDDSDQVVSKLSKLNLSTEQLKTVVAYQNDHRAFIRKAHTEGLGCRAHESNVAVFEKQAIGILNDAQFKSYAGRERNEMESLRYQNHLLAAEVERLKAEVAKLKAEKGTKAAAPAASEAKKEGCEGQKESGCKKTDTGA